MKNLKTLEQKSSADRITCFLPLYYNPLEREFKKNKKMTDSTDHEASGTNDCITNDPDGKHFEMLKYALSFAVKKTGIGSDSM